MTVDAEHGAYRILGPADAPILIVGDHASNRVPPGIDLSVDPWRMNEHIAIDIGVGRIAEILVEGGGYQAILANCSRLVIDLNRDLDAPGIVPLSSDGIAIPGNVGADIAARIRTLYDPYHAKVEELAAARAEPFLLSIHSFTPSLASRPEEERPWHVGILYNEDERAAPLAIAALQAECMEVGDQMPYSGRLLNATMNRHAEAHNRHYLGVEIRQDQIMDEVGQQRFADILRRVVGYVSQTLQNRAV